MAIMNLDSFSDRELASRIVTDHQTVRRAWTLASGTPMPTADLTRDDWRLIQEAHDGTPMQVWFDPSALLCVCKPGARVVLANYPRSAMCDEPSGVGLVCLHCHESCYAELHNAAESTAVFQFIVENAIRNLAARCPLYFSTQRGLSGVYPWTVGAPGRPVVHFYKPGTVGRSLVNAALRKLALFHQIPENGADIERRRATYVQWHGQYPKTFTLTEPTAELEPLRSDESRVYRPLPVVDPVTGGLPELGIKSSHRKPYDPRTPEERARGVEKMRLFMSRYGCAPPPVPSLPPGQYRVIGSTHDDMTVATVPPPTGWSDAAALAERALTLLTSAGQVHDFVGTRTKVHATDCRACRGAADAKRALEMLRAYQKGKG